MSDRNPTETRFASQLQAQWAAFFGILGIPYEYRARLVALRDGVYTPDFWLADQQAWVDICETYPSDAEAARAKAVVAATTHPVYVLCGEFRAPQSVYDDHIDGYDYTPEGGGADYWWCECPVCGVLGITYWGWSRKLPCRCVWRVPIAYEKEYTYAAPRLVAAYDTVRALNLADLPVTAPKS